MGSKTVSTILLSPNRITLPEKALTLASGRDIWTAIRRAVPGIAQYCSYPHIRYVDSRDEAIQRGEVTQRFMNDIDLVSFNPMGLGGRAAWMRLLTQAQADRDQSFAPIGGYRLQFVTNDHRYSVYIAPAKDIVPHGPEERWGAVTRYG